MPVDPSMLMPFDLQAQNQRIQQQQALQQAFAQRAMTPAQGQMVSGHYVSPGIGGAIGQIGQAMLSNFAGNRADAGNQAFQQDYSKRLGDELRGYLQTQQGVPGNNGAVVNDDEGNKLPDVQAADPKEAMLKAMTSQFGQMQGIGQQSFGSYLKSLEPHYFTTKEGETSSVRQNGVTTVIGKGPNKTVTAGDQIWERGPDGKMQVVADARDKYTPVSVLGTDPATGKNIMGVKDLATGKPIYAPSATTVSVDNKIDQHGANKALDELPDVLKGIRSQVIKAQSNTQQADQILALVNDPQTIAGALSHPGGIVAGLGAAVGFTGPEAASKTQALLSALASNTLDASTELKGAISDKEKPFLEEAKSGRLAYTKEAIAHLANLTKQASYNVWLNAVRQRNSAIGVKGGDEIEKLFPIPTSKHYLDDKIFQEDPDTHMMGYNGTYAIPGSQQGGGGAGAGMPNRGQPMSAEDYLKSKGVM